MKLISTILAALALVLVSAQAGAGVMLWQVTGMEGSRYAMAGKIQRIEQTSTAASALWSGWGVHGTAAYVMRRELWQHLQAWMAWQGRVAPGAAGVPSYRDLISSGYISVNTIGMPECMGNNK